MDTVIITVEPQIPSLTLQYDEEAQCWVDNNGQCWLDFESVVKELLKKTWKVKIEHKKGGD